MTSTILRSGLAALACAAALALASPSMAAMVNFHATLSGKSEVPANTTAGTGTVTATLNTDSNELTWKGTYSGLTGPATAAHFHGPAPAGKNAGVMIPIVPNTSPLEGTAKLKPEQTKALMDGDMYVNVHTAANKGGEIRGQLVK